jgi:hypothetical protein
MGFADALLGVAAPIFVAEIAQHDTQGTLSSFLYLALQWSTSLV